MPLLFSDGSSPWAASLPGAPPPPLPGTQVMVRDSSAPPGWPAAHQIGVNQYQEHLLIGRCGDAPRHSPAGTGVWKASQAPCTDHSLWQ